MCSKYFRHRVVGRKCQRCCIWGCRGGGRMDFNDFYLAVNQFERLEEGDPGCGFGIVVERERHAGLQIIQIESAVEKTID